MTLPFLQGANFGRLQPGPAEDVRHAILGLPFDLAVTNRPGARFGPRAIRQASWMLTDGAHPVWGVDPLARTDVADRGDLEPLIGDATASWARIAAAVGAELDGGRRTICLGGDHSVAAPILAAIAGRRGRDYALVHFDAHVDTWDGIGGRWTHGSPFFQAIEDGCLDPAAYLQIGIRSPTPPELWAWQRARGIVTLSAIDVHAQGIAAVLAAVDRVVGARPLYVTFDIDALDPSCAPGTGTPEVGGLLTWQAQAILRGLKGRSLIGLDVVEVAPAYDVAEITALAAAQIVYEYLAIVD